MFEVLRTAVSSLWANKTRSMLTMLGVVIGVGAVIAMVAVGNGASRQMEGVISSMGANMIVLRPGSQNLGGVRQGEPPGTEHLAWAERIQGCAGTSSRGQIPVKKGSVPRAESADSGVRGWGIPSKAGMPRVRSAFGRAGPTPAGRTGFSVLGEARRWGRGLSGHPHGRGLRQ